MRALCKTSENSMKRDLMIDSILDVCMSYCLVLNILLTYLLKLKTEQFKSKSAPEGCASDSNIVLIQDLHEYPQKANPQSCSCTQSVTQFSG